MLKAAAVITAGHWSRPAIFSGSSSSRGGGGGRDDVGSTGHRETKPHATMALVQQPRARRLSKQAEAGRCARLAKETKTKKKRVAAESADAHVEAADETRQRVARIVPVATNALANAWALRSSKGTGPRERDVKPQPPLGPSCRAAKGRGTPAPR